MTYITFLVHEGDEVLATGRGDTPASANHAAIAKYTAEFIKNSCHPDAIVAIEEVTADIEQGNLALICATIDEER